MANGKSSSSSRAAVRIALASDVEEDLSPQQVEVPSTTTVQQDDPDTEGNLAAVKMPRHNGGQQSMTPSALQREAERASASVEKIAVRLILASPSDADGIRHYDEELPIQLVRGILSPTVADFFIPIEGAARTKPPATKKHYLHTSQIREVLLFGELPEGDVTI